MAHPRLSARLDRTFIAAGAAAMFLALPLAGAASAQTLEGAAGAGDAAAVDAVLDPVTGDLVDAVTGEVIATAAELAAAAAEAEAAALAAPPAETAAGPIDDVVEAAAGAAGAAVSVVDEVVGQATGGESSPLPDPAPADEQEAAGESAQPVSEPSSGVGTAGNGVEEVAPTGPTSSLPLEDVGALEGDTTVTPPPAVSGGPQLGGLRSNSDLVLQHFEPPVVSVPFTVDIPKIAQELTLPSSPLAPIEATRSFAANVVEDLVPRSAPGWLVATAGGLLMAAAAAHGLRAAGYLRSDWIK